MLQRAASLLRSLPNIEYHSSTTLACLAVNGAMGGRHRTGKFFFFERR